MDRVEIGKKIKQLRVKQNLSQCKLATNAGVSPSYIVSLEKGEKCPTVETLGNICYALHISLPNFLSSETCGVDKISTLTPKQKKLLNDFLESL